MAYTPNVWVDDDPGTTPGAVGGAVNAARMNWMETGIGAAHTTADAAVPKSLVDAAGDLIVGSANDTVARLAKGADGQWLRMTGGALVWSNIAAADIQDITTRVDVRKNSAGSVFSRRRLNLIEGSNVTLTVADDSGSEEVDITVAAAASAQALTLITDSGFLGAAQANFDFTAIAATWNHLRLVVYARGDTAATSTPMLLRLNNDSAGNYDYQQFLGNAAAASTAESFGQTSIVAADIPANTAGANLFSYTVYDIPFYLSANNKDVQATHSFKRGTATTNMIDEHTSGFWRSNAAITRVTVLPTAGNFQIGSRAMLYGIT